MATAVALARRALEFGSDDAVTVVIGGFVLVTVGRDYNAGLDAVSRAVTQNPGSGFVATMAGCAMVFGDELEDGLIMLERAMVLCPLDPNFSTILTVAGCAHLFLGHPEKAAELAERSIALNPDWDSQYWLLIVAYAQLNRLADARQTLVRLLEQSPGASIENYRKFLPFRNPDSLQVVLDGLRQAGLPEGA